MVEPSEAERSEWPDATRAYVEALEDRVEEFRKALLLARSWGIHSSAFHGGVSISLADWVDGGMFGPPPVVPSHLKQAS